MTHLRDAQPHACVGLVVGKANHNVGGFIRVQNKPLVSVGRADGLNLAVELPIVVHVERSGSLRALAKRDFHSDNVLRMFEVVLDAAPPVSFDEVALTRPARVGVETVVSSVFRPTAIGAASISGRPLVETSGVH